MILGFSPGSGILHRAHPFTLGMLVVATLVAVFVLPAPTGALSLLVFLVVLAMAGGAGRVMPTAIALAAPFWLFLLLIHVVIGDAPDRAITVGTQVSAMIVVFLVFLAVTHPGRLVDAMLEKRLPSGLAYLTVAALQTVPRLQAKATAIRDAQRVRGLRTKSVGQKTKAVLPLAMPLILGALHEVDERALALASRGVGRGLHPTPLHPPLDTLADRIARLLLLAFLLATVVFRLVS